ncbi:MAG: GIY-YIG nuclease family protein [Candidatus Omnitrophica bacterium]|nr:GIY-YIG nuclease family protein [Candidatus Omnitrophota bacterium]
MLKYKPESEGTKRVPLVVTYSKCLPDIRGILKKHKATLHRSDRMKEIFDKPPLLAFRRGRNLCDALVHAKTKKVVPPVKCVCTCDVCQRIIRDRIQDTGHKESFPVVGGVDCKTDNLVYALVCKKCDKTVYVGETGRTLRERLQEHLRDVRGGKEKPINNHFHGHTHDEVQVAVLKTMDGDSRFHRLLWEERFIEHLRTVAPFGCNVQVN